MPIAWIPLSDELDYQRDVVRLAPTFGCTQIQLSHHICHNADDLLEDESRARRAREIAALHRDAGLEVWCWTHEFRSPPEEFVTDKVLDLDHPGLWAYLAEKYARFFTRVLPGIDGLVLTFAETHYPVYKEQRIRSALSREERTAQLIHTLRDVCRAHGKRLAIRDFVYRLDEIERMTATINGMDDDVIVMSKCVPHDWEPFYPHNPTIGAYGRKPQWVEYDLGHEYEGQQLYPFAEAETLLERLRYGHTRGVELVALRLDRTREIGRQSALYRPWGRLELLTFALFERDPHVSPEAVYAEWGKEQYPGARELVQTATQCVYKSLFALRFWIANHSNLPPYNYALTHINDGNADRLPTWTGAPEDLEADANFRAMPRAWLDACLDEADEAQALSARCRALLDAAPADAPDRAAWEEGVRNLEWWSELFAAYKRAYFRLRFLELHPGELDPAEVARSIDTLEDSCNRIGPQLATHRLERGCPAEHFAEVIASLREQLSRSSGEGQ